MTNNPLISVIIPTYNEEKYIRRCLSSLKKQKTDYRYEILVIDHKSLDNTAKIAKSLGARCINESRRGTAVARQTGIENAKGAIVAFTEADCVAPLNWIKTIGDHFTKYPTHVGLVGRYHFDDLTLIAKKKMLIFMMFSNKFIRFFFKTYPFRGTNSAAKKEILLRAGGFSEEKAPFDDWDASQRVSKYGIIAYNPKLIVATSSRRIKNRTFSYIKEFIYSYIRIYLLGHKGNIAWYKIIR